MKTLIPAAILVLAPLALQAAEPRAPGGFLAQWDTNGDGVVTRDEAQAAASERAGKRFDMLDTNKDGTLTQEELDQRRAKRADQMRQEMSKRLAAADKDGDGGLSLEEAKQGMPGVARRFDALDADKDGIVTRDELTQAAQKRSARHRH